MSIYVNRRALGCARGELAETREQWESTTGRLRDKRAQCAPRLVRRVVRSSPPSAQGARADRNVRPARNSLTFCDLSHIAEVGDGR